MLRRFTAVGVVTLLLFTLGCGNKGPLYLPQDTAATADGQDEEARR